MIKKVKDRVELDHRLRANGHKGLFSSDEARDKAKWVLKNVRLGNDRKRIDPRELV